MQTTRRPIATTATRYQVNWLRPEDVDELWPSIWRLVEPATDPNFAIPESALREALKSGRRQCWVVVGHSDIMALLVIEALDRQLFIHTIAGTGLREWADLLESKLKTYAREIGADVIRAYTRTGFVRFLERRGWKAAATVMEVPIDG